MICVLYFSIVHTAGKIRLQYRRRRRGRLGPALSEQWSPLLYMQAMACGSSFKLLYTILAQYRDGTLLVRVVHVVYSMSETSPSTAPYSILLKSVNW